MRLLPNSARLAAVIGTLLICVTLTLASGCGRKFFPKLIGDKAAPQVNDLQAQITSRGVELSWSIPEGATDGKYRYSVTKSELKWENRNCPECPGLTQRETHAIDAGSVATALTAPNRRLQWLDTNTAPFRAFRYQVAMHDEKDQPLTLSAPVVAKVYPLPPAPGAVAAATQPQGILVQWKPVSKDAQGHNLQGELAFRVERMSPGKPWEKASPSPVKGNTYLDQTIASELSYSYRVVPVLLVDNSAISGEPSSVVLAKAPESVPPPPPNSVWVIPAHGALEVRWTESDGKIGGYHVYRREGKELIRLTATPVQHPPFIDKNIKRNAAYSYAVSAVSAQADHKEGLLSKWAEMRALLLE
ncbi:MAG: hypothetical protein WAW37_08925 [Syntrophobacteraceae bacterium]